MAYQKLKQGGSGGKLGHSNMSHWSPTGEIKRHSKTARRLDEKIFIKSITAENFENIGINEISEPSKKKQKRSSGKSKKQGQKNYMTKVKVDELIQILSKGKIKFYYFKDYYAFLLLSYLISAKLPISKIKKTTFSRLLNKPIIQQVISSAGSSILTKELLFSHMATAQECYLLTFGRWGYFLETFSPPPFYNQTSRCGYNLVLQLNFSNKHNKSYYRLIKPKDKHPFEYEAHPIAKKGYHTLAWSRIDISDDFDYALIEEIQNDWIRLATKGRTTIETVTEDNIGNRRVVQQNLRRINTNKNDLQIYVDTVLKPHMRIWDEAMLAATIWLLKEEIEVKKIYYHSWESGNILKEISSGRCPPKSLYKNLPEKFCFVETEDVPPFLKEKVEKLRKSGVNPIKFYLLTFDVK